MADFGRQQTFMRDIDKGVESSERATVTTEYMNLAIPLM
jgi:hypothetical protein